MKKKIILFVLFFNTFTVLMGQSKDSAWAILQFTIKNKPCLAVIDMGLKDFKNKSSYPIALFIDVETKDRAETNGWPTPEENLLFNTVEDQFINTVNNTCSAKYIGRTTLDGSREIIFYIDKKEKIEKALLELKQSGKVTRNFEYSFYDHPAWEEVYLFYK